MDLGTKYCLFVPWNVFLVLLLCGEVCTFCMSGHCSESHRGLKGICIPCNPGWSVLSDQENRTVYIYVPNQSGSSDWTQGYVDAEQGSFFSKIWGLKISCLCNSCVSCIILKFWQAFGWSKKQSLLEGNRTLKYCYHHVCKANERKHLWIKVLHVQRKQAVHYGISVILKRRNVCFSIEPQSPMLQFKLFFINFNIHCLIHIYSYRWLHIKFFWYTRKCYCSSSLLDKTVVVFLNLPS